MVPEIWSSTDRIILSSWPIFCLFTPLTAQKNENIKNEKRPWRFYHVTQVYHKIMTTRYTVPEMRRETDVIFIFHCGLLLFALLSPNNLKKENCKKFWKRTATATKTTWRYHHFTKLYQKSWSYAILFLRYMVHDGCNCCFSFWAIFCPFTALTAQKVKVSKKWKKYTHTWKYHHSAQVCQKSWWYAILLLGYGGWQM